MKVFCAYLIPHEDHHLLTEDGISFFEVGNTPLAATKALRAEWEHSVPDVPWEEVEENNSLFIRSYEVNT